MECILEAHPLPDILWYHVDTKLKNSDRIKMVRKSTSKDVHILSLEIRDPTIEDGGAYRCNAVNLYGESNANIALNFQGNSLSTTVHELLHDYIKTHPHITCAGSYSLELSKRNYSIGARIMTF